MTAISESLSPPAMEVSRGRERDCRQEVRSAVERGGTRPTRRVDPQRQAFRPAADEGPHPAEGSEMVASSTASGAPAQVHSNALRHVESGDVGGLGGKCGIIALAPGFPLGKVDLVRMCGPAALSRPVPSPHGLSSKSYPCRCRRSAVSSTCGFTFASGSTVRRGLADNVAGESKVN